MVAEESKNGGSRPVPDPTFLTTQQIDEKIRALRDYTDGQLAVRDERLRGIDVATNVRLDLVHGMPDRIDEKLKCDRDLTDEKMASIAQQFRERDTRSERESRYNKVAVDAAFAAQIEANAKQNQSNQLAIDKSEKATAETINKLTELFNTSNQAIADKVAEIARRVERIESTAIGTAVGAQDVRGNQQRTQALAFGLVGVAIAATGVVGAIVATR